MPQPGKSEVRGVSSDENAQGRRFCLAFEATDVDDADFVLQEDTRVAGEIDGTEAEKVGGKLYAIPTYKDSSASQYFIWDQNLADDS